MSERESHNVLYKVTISTLNFFLFDSWNRSEETCNQM